MADGLCGGSAPYKGLLNHHDRDRSLEQDRTSTTVPGLYNSFRDQPGGSVAQSSYDAFLRAAPNTAPHPTDARLGMSSPQAGPSTFPTTAGFHQGIGPAHHSHVSLPMVSGTTVSPNMAPAGPAATSWIQDYARLNMDSTPAPLHGLVRPIASPLAPPMMNTPVTAPFLPSEIGGFGVSHPFTPLFGPTNGGYLDPIAASAQRPAAEAEFALEMDRWMREHGGAGHTEDIDAIMEQIANEMDEVNRIAQSAGKEAIAEVSLSGDAADSSHTDRAAEGLESRTTDAETERAFGTSGVSDVARQILESVNHEDGTKWKNSAFLALMRDFRDGRKDVVGNEILEAPEDNPNGPSGPTSQP